MRRNGAHKPRIAGLGMLVPLSILTLTVVLLLLAAKFQPQPLELSGLHETGWHYGLQEALLKVSADVQHRRLRLAEGESRFVELQGNELLVRRQPNFTVGGEPPVAVYLLEGLISGHMPVQFQGQNVVRETQRTFDRIQIGWLDLQPDGEIGVLRLGIWRNRPLRR